MTDERKGITRDRSDKERGMGRMLWNDGEKMGSTERSKRAGREGGRYGENGIGAFHRTLGTSTMLQQQWP